MTKYIRLIGTPLALSTALVLSACSPSEKAKSDGALGRDTALNRDLQLANRDTAVQPQLRDVPAVPAPAPAVVPAPAPTPMRTAPTPMRTAPRPVPSPVRSTPRAAPARPDPTPAPTTTASARSDPTPAPTTTASGNTVTRNTSGSSSSSAGGSVGTIAAGASLSLRSNSRVCTNTYTVGQTFSATVANAVTGTNGATIPAGATASLEVTQLKRSENSNDKIIMEFAVRSVSFGGRSYPVSASVASADIDRVRNQPQGKDAQKVAIGAAAGAIIGQVLGKSTKATIIGGAAGAAAGAGVAAGTANYEGCLADGGNIAVTLNSPLQVKITS